jgi:hypothetical protein
MPIETRYMRSDQHTVNGLLAYKLGTSQSATLLSVLINVYDRNVYVTQYFGIKVWKRDVNGVETLIADIGAIASASSSGLISGTINIPLISLNSTDAIVVEVYADDFSPPTTLRATFITEQLGAQSLNASTWTVYYYLYRAYAAATQQTSYFFRFGTSTYNSHIENFAWTPVPVAVKKPIMNGLVYVE